MQGLPVPFIQVRQFVVVMCLLVFFPKRKVKYPGCAFTLEHVPDEGKGGCMGQGCPAPLLHMELPWALGGTHCIPLHWLKQQVPLVHVHLRRATSVSWLSQQKQGRLMQLSLSPGPHPAWRGSLSQERLNLPATVLACRQGAEGLFSPSYCVHGLLLS